MSSDSFAFVIGPVEMEGLGFLPVWGVLREQFGVREIAFFSNSIEKDQFVGDFCTVPSNAGEPTVLLTYSDEIMVISDILDQAPRSVVDGISGSLSNITLDDVHIEEDDPVTPEMPVAFGRIRDVARTGVALTPRLDSFDVHFDQLVVARLGWKVGDQVAFGLDGSGTRVAISRVSEGSVLYKADDGGLETLAGMPFPSWMLNSPNSSVVTPMVEIHDSAIVFSVSSLNQNDFANAKGMRRFVHFADLFLIALSVCVFAFWIANRFVFHL